MKLRLHDDDDDDDEDEEDEMTIFVFYLYKACVVHRRMLPFLPEKEQRREGGFLSRILLGFFFLPRIVDFAADFPGNVGWEILPRFCGGKAVGRNFTALLSNSD